MNILTVIPARKGSKGLPKKNESFIEGKSLFSWVWDEIRDIDGLPIKICSSDSQVIGALAKQVGWEVPFIRPANLAGDKVKVIEVINHALDFFELENKKFTHVLVLQTTSPTVTKNDIEKAIKLAANDRYDTIISAYKWQDVNPSTMFTKVDGSDQLNWVMDGSYRELRRQDFPNIFVRTGLFYLARTDVIRKGTFYGERIGHVEIEKNRAICIDDEKDFKAAEDYLKLRGRNE